MKIYFSDFFEVNQEIIKEYEAFNISLLNDLPLFIDPFLIFCSEKAEYQQLHNSIIKYLIFLRDEAQEQPCLSIGMMNLWYKFPEVKQTYLGFCEDGNSGSGLGKDFAIALHSGLKDIFKDFGNENITKSTHVEKLCLIKPHVGRDNISDFVTNLIKEYLLIYTEEFAKNNIDPKYCKEFNVAKVVFDYEKKVWLAKKFYLPIYDNDFVLLTPSDLLVRADTWINKSDMHKNIQSIKHVIEDCDGYRWFYDGDKPIRRESDLHIMYKLVCYDTYADFNSEVNNGRGPVDFKASNSSKDMTLIEFKLTRTLKKNLEKQVDVYKDANNTDKAIKVIMYFTDDEYRKTVNILNELGLTGKPGIVLIDAIGAKVQASKVK